MLISGVGLMLGNEAEPALVTHQHRLGLAFKNLSKI